MRPQSYVIGIDRALSWGFATIATIYAATWVIALAGARGDAGSWLWLAIVGFCAAAGATCWAAFRRVVATTDVAWMFVASLAVQVTWVLTAVVHLDSGLRVTTVGVVVFGALLFARRGPRGVMVVTTIGVELWADVSRGDLASATEAMLPIATSVTVAILIARVLRRAAAAADKTRELAQRAKRSETHEKVRFEARETVRALLHDHVAAALRAISLSVVDESEVRIAARMAVEETRRVDADPDVDSQDVMSVLEALVGTQEGIEFVSSGPVIVPSEVAMAIEGAVSEAVRNAFRHADATHVEVRVERKADGVVIAVVDDGVGFQPDAEMMGSYGLRYSIARRMELVGGAAEIMSSPGAGATILIRWTTTAVKPVNLPLGRVARADVVVGDLRRAFAAVAIPFLCLSGFWAVRFTASGDLPAWLLLWFAGMVGLTGVALVRMRRGIPGWYAAVAVVFGLAGTLVVLFALPAGSLDGYAGWPVGAMASLFAILIASRSRWEALAALTVHQGALLVATFTGHFEPGPWWSALTKAAPAMASTLLPVAMAWVIPEFLARLGDDVTRSNAEIASRQASQLSMWARTVARQQWLEGARADVLPFLEDVANGRRVVATPETMILARTLEGEVRDRLAFPGLLDSVTRERIRGARARGCRVVLQGSDTTPPDPVVVQTLIATALSGVFLPSEVAVSISARGDDTAACLVAIPGDVALERELIRVFGPEVRVIESTPDATWAEVLASGH